MAKKGLSPLAWVGIGCGGLIVVGGIIFLAAGIFVAKKAKDFVEDGKRNPALAMAKTIAMVNPDLEVVGSDDEAQTVTIRDTKTGKDTTFTLKDLEDGKLTIETEDGKTEFHAADGGATITGGDGSEITYGNAVEIPEWLPVYPGTKPHGVAASSTRDSVTGSIQLETPDAIETVIAWYTEALEDDGYVLADKTDISGDNGRMHVFSARHADTATEFSFNLQGEKGGPTRVFLTYKRGA